MKNVRVQVFMEIALCAALAMLLDIVMPSVSWGFTLSVKMVPIIILALRRGLLPGLLGGFVWGLLQYILGDAYILSLVQFVLEYFVAFALVGTAGIFSKKMQGVLKEEPKAYVKQAGLAISATLVGSFARYVIHFLAGAWFWGSYAPEGQSPYVYSFLVNGGAFLSETLACLLVMLLLVKSYRSLLYVKNTGY